jgi:hypothetical protein
VFPAVLLPVATQILAVGERFQPGGLSTTSVHLPGVDREREVRGRVQETLSRRMQHLAR